MLFLEASDPAAEWQSVRAVATASVAVQTAVLASHAAFLVPIALGARYRLMLALILTSAALLFSLAYHTCAVTELCMGTTLELLRQIDHATANFMSIALLSLFFVYSEQSARWRRAVLVELRAAAHPDELLAPDADGEAAVSPEDAALVDEAVREDDGADGRPTLATYHLQFERLWLPLMLLAVFLAVLYHPYDVYPAYVTLAMGALSVLVFHVVFYFERRARLPDGRPVVWAAPVNWRFFLPAVGLGVGGLAFYFFDHVHPLMHAAWHVLIALAVGFAILAVVK